MQTGKRARRGTVSVNQNSKKFLRSELNDEDRQYIIDVARPDPDKPPPDDMSYTDPGSEIVLKDLCIVAHSSTGDDMREIMMTIEAEKFDVSGHTSIKLQDGIYRTYKDVYGSHNRALAMVNANIKTTRSVLPNTIFYDKADGESMLLVLVFYMGIDDGGKKE